MATRDQGTRNITYKRISGKIKTLGNTHSQGKQWKGHLYVLNLHQVENEIGLYEFEL